jgi:hypothetical protein
VSCWTSWQGPCGTTDGKLVRGTKFDVDTMVSALKQSWRRLIKSIFILGSSYKKNIQPLIKRKKTHSITHVELLVHQFTTNRQPRKALGLMEECQPTIMRPLLLHPAVRQHWSITCTCTSTRQHWGWHSFIDGERTIAVRGGAATWK